MLSYNRVGGQPDIRSLLKQYFAITCSFHYICNGAEPSLPHLALLLQVYELVPQASRLALATRQLFLQQSHFTFQHILFFAGIVQQFVQLRLISQLPSLL